MKRFCFVFLSVSLLFSCVTVQDKMLTPQEWETAEVIGRVSTEFINGQILHIYSKKRIARRAYSKLMAEIRNQYQGNIDVVNVTADGTYNPLTLLPLPFAAGFLGNFQTIRVTGDVVIYSSAGRSGPINQENLSNVLEATSKTLIERLPDNSTIAILNISSSNRSNSEYIINELEYRLVDSRKFTIVDRRRLDQIRNELDFQMSGDVDDSSAITIGNMLGANIVITGDVAGSGTSQWLNIKALDVMTARIIAMAREQL